MEEKWNGEMGLILETWLSLVLRDKLILKAKYISKLRVAGVIYCLFKKLSQQTSEQEGD